MLLISYVTSEMEPFAVANFTQAVVFRYLVRIIGFTCWKCLRWKSWSLYLGSRYFLVSCLLLCILYYLVWRLVICRKKKEEQICFLFGWLEGMFLFGTRNYKRNMYFGCYVLLGNPLDFTSMNYTTRYNRWPCPHVSLLDGWNW